MQGRNSGIDLLRIVSMLAIVMLHVLGKGGLLQAGETFSINYEIVWLLEIFSLWAVNCCAIISGYVGIGTKFKYSRVVELWMQVFFYSITIMTAFKIFIPDMVSNMEILSRIFPVMSGQYWYFTSYFAAFFFFPYLNKFVNSVQKNKLNQIIITIFILFSFLPTVFNKDVFVTHKGYSPLWIVCLYIIGAYIRKYSINISKRRAFLVFILCIVVTWFSKLMIQFAAYKVFNKVYEGNVYVTYTSPFILVAAVMLVLFFSQIKLSSKTSYFISYLSKYTFGVYIIHCNWFVIKFVIRDAFSPWITLPPYFMVLKIIGSVIGIYIVCMFIDMIRGYIFRLLKVGNICEMAGKYIEKLLPSEAK